MTIQINGDDRRESGANQTSREQFEIWAQKFSAKADLSRANGGANYTDSVVDIAWIAWKSSRDVLETKPQSPLLLPPPITEADGYRLNTSWHSGAIFRDGANWMRNEAMRLGAGIPDGWQLVPVAPTPKQWAAGLKAMEGGIDKVTLAYKAMLDASPEAPC